jgi:hypothetical protein
MSFNVLAWVDQFLNCRDPGLVHQGGRYQRRPCLHGPIVGNLEVLRHRPGTSSGKHADRNPFHSWSYLWRRFEYVPEVLWELKLGIDH